MLDLLAKKETFGEDLDIRVPIHPPWVLEDATVLEDGSSTLGNRYHGSARIHGVVVPCVALRPLLAHERHVCARTCVRACACVRACVRAWYQRAYTLFVP